MFKVLGQYVLHVHFVLLEPFPDGTRDGNAVPVHNLVPRTLVCNHINVPVERIIRDISRFCATASMIYRPTPELTWTASSVRELLIWSINLQAYIPQQGSRLRIRNSCWRVNS